MLKTRLSLKNFFIFNSTFCTRESEDENKILFFYPEIDINDKLKDVGFIEALIKFTGSFSLDEAKPKDVLTMKTAKTLKLFYQPEQDFWIVLTLNVPFERKEKDKKEFIEYHSDDAHEAVFKRVLQSFYLHFRLFCNTFESNMIGDGLEAKLTNLRTRLDMFYTRYLLTVDLHNADIVDCIESIQYKPVTHLIFFKIVNFLNLVTSMKSLRIKKSIFLYNEEVVYSSIGPKELFIVNEYLTDSLFPKFLQLRNSQSVVTDRSVGCFVTELDCEAAPRVYLQEDAGQPSKAYRLVVYTILDVSLVMFVEDEADCLNEEFTSEIKGSIAPQLGLISKEISANFLHFQQQNASVKCQQSEEPTAEKYIYFNHKNHRFHAALYDDDATALATSNQEGRKTQLSSSVMNLLCDLYAKDVEDDDESLMSSEKETIIKTFNDYWLCSKTFNNRSIYMILQKSSTLIDIALESEKLISEIVKNVYFTNQQ